MRELLIFEFHLLHIPCLCEVLYELYFESDVSGSDHHIIVSEINIEMFKKEFSRIILDSSAV